MSLTLKKNRPCRCASQSQLTTWHDRAQLHLKPTLHYNIIAGKPNPHVTAARGHVVWETRTRSVRASFPHRWCTGSRSRPRVGIRQSAPTPGDRPARRLSTSRWRNWDNYWGSLVKSAPKFGQVPRMISESSTKGLWGKGAKTGTRMSRDNMSFCEFSNKIQPPYTGRFNGLNNYKVTIIFFLSLFSMFLYGCFLIVKINNM